SSKGDFTVNRMTLGLICFVSAVGAGCNQHQDLGYDNSNPTSASSSSNGSGAGTPSGSPTNGSPTNNGSTNGSPTSADSGLPPGSPNGTGDAGTGNPTPLSNMDIVHAQNLDGEIDVSGTFTVHAGATLSSPTGDLTIHASSIVVEAGANIIMA